MRVFLFDDEHVRRFIVLAALKTIDDARRDALCAKHHNHRRRKIFAVPFTNVKQKIR